MPDDDKFTRDHGAGWTGATRALLRDRPDRPDPGDELPFDERDPGSEPPVNRQRHGEFDADTGAAVLRALEHTIGDLGGRPDLHAAAEDLRALARGLHEETLDPDELCTHPTASGTDAIVRQAIRVLAATRRAEALVSMPSEELAAQLAEEFLRGVGRRYGIDRLAPFDPSALDPVSDALPDALGILSGFDMFLIGPLARGLIAELIE